MPQSPLRPAVFLDRDGTLNVEKSYLHSADEWEWLPGVPEGLALLQRAGLALVVVTNQSGIARGYYSEEDMHHLHTFVQTDLRRYGVHIDGFYHCPHLPELTGECTCRKPNPGLFLQAAQDLGLNLAASWCIGDAARDMHAAQRVGCRPLLVRTGYGATEQSQVPEVPTFANFASATAHILARI